MAARMDMDDPMLAALSVLSTASAAAAEPTPNAAAVRIEIGLLAVVEALRELLTAMQAPVELTRPASSDPDELAKDAQHYYALAERFTALATLLERGLSPVYGEHAGIKHRLAQVWQLTSDLRERCEDAGAKLFLAEARSEPEGRESMLDEAIAAADQH